MSRAGFGDPLPPLPVGGGGGGRGGNVTLIISKTIYTEHELELQGFAMKEIFEYVNQSTIDGEPFRTIVIHTRAIGGRVVQMTETRAGGQVVASAVNTTMNESEIPGFEAEWGRLWTPSLREDSLLAQEQAGAGGRIIGGGGAPGAGAVPVGAYPPGHPSAGPGATHMTLTFR